MHDPTQQLSTIARVFNARVATWLNKTFKGSLQQRHLTLVTSITIGAFIWALWINQPVLAALLLIYSEISTALGNALARVQHKESKFSKIADFCKETCIYAGLGLYATKHDTSVALWLVLAVACSAILIRYLTVKKQIRSAKSRQTKEQREPTSEGGITQYEIRLLLLFVGLLLDLLTPFLRLLLAINVLAIVGHFTTLDPHTLPSKKSK